MDKRYLPLSGILIERDDGVCVWNRVAWRFLLNELVYMCLFVASTPSVVDSERGFVRGDGARLVLRAEC